MWSGSAHTWQRLRCRVARMEIAMHTDTTRVGPRKTFLHSALTLFDRLAVPGQYRPASVSHDDAASSCASSSAPCVRGPAMRLHGAGCSLYSSAAADSP
ncbi:hypothetical protein D3C71_832010 [compost metagenome]